MLQRCSLRFKKLLRRRDSYMCTTVDSQRELVTEMANVTKGVRYSLFTALGLCVIVVLTMIPNLQEPTVRIATRISLPVLWSTPVQSEYLNQWCGIDCDDSVAPAQLLSKELIVRRVFFDNRPKPGNHSNATVFLVEGKGSFRPSRFSGCRVGDYDSSVLRFRKPVSYKWVQRHKDAKSTLAMIECYDIPVVENGDLASLYYRGSRDNVMEILPLKPLLVPEPRAEVDSSKVTAVVCVGMVRSGAHPP